MQLFSALYSMLPSAKNYLIKGGYAPDVAAFILIGCFLAGVVGIQILSRFLHHYIPSHVVDCDHTHEAQEESGSDDDSDDTEYHNGHIHSSEETPLLAREHPYHTCKDLGRPRTATLEPSQRPEAPAVGNPLSRRPSLQTRLTTRMSSFVSGVKTMCDEGGPCYGYSEPCGQECFKAVSRSPTRSFMRRQSTGPSRYPRVRRTPTHQLSQSVQNLPGRLDEDLNGALPDGHGHNKGNSHIKVIRGRQDHSRSSSHHPPSGNGPSKNGDLESASQKRGLSAVSNPPNDPAQAHHHHVPSNAFLSIGLQTSIAIALHKLPEGFITYATNHANPKLGFAVFMALFIHNITEGFAMALPLYLALGSRWKAMFWSSLLGGISQPLGAGVAAMWFKLAGSHDMTPGERIYGGMFAVTAGIMTSVALQLFSESLSLTHNRNMCVAFAFVGMAILGLSFALTAE